MKTISKRALAVLLSVLMVLSVFTIIPFTASAEVSVTNYYLANNSSGAWQVSTTPASIYFAKFEGEDYSKATLVNSIENGGTYAILIESYYRAMHVAGTSTVDRCGANVSDAINSGVGGSYTNSCGASHAFTITALDDGTYTIQAVGGSNYYLTVSDSAVGLSEDSYALHIDPVNADSGIFNVYYQVVEGEPDPDPDPDPEPAPDLEEGLVGYWNFDQDDITTTVANQVADAANFDGTLSGSGVSVVDGKLHFDGTTDSKMTISSAIDTTNYDYTVSMWLKIDPSVLTRSAKTVLLQQTGTGRTVLYYNTNGRLGTFMSGSDIIATTSTPSAGTWHNVVMTSEKDTHTVRIYVDGEEVALQNNTITPDTQPGVTDLIFGAHKNAGDAGVFVGDMDEIRYYKAALDADKVKALYEANGSKVTVEAGEGTESVDVAADDCETVDGTVYLFHQSSSEDTIPVTLSSTPVVFGIDFEGWKNGDETVEVGEDGVYNYDPADGDITLTAAYTIDTTIPSEDLIAIDNETLLTSNARASSEQTPLMWDHDGDATLAFSREGDWWHSRYDASNVELREENKINGVPCDDGDNSRGIVDAAAGKYVWLQTGFNDGNDETDDTRLIGGISVLGRSAGNGNVKDFEVWVSDHEDMDNNPHVVAYDGSFAYSPGETQKVTFDEPVAGTYVRIVIKEVWHQGNSASPGDQHAAIDTLTIFEVLDSAALKVFPSVVAANNGLLNDILEWQEFFTQDSIDAYTNAIAEANAVLESGIITAEEVVEAIAVIDEAKGGLEYTYYTVTVSGDGTAAGLSAAPAEGNVAYQVNDTTVYFGANTTNALYVIASTTEDAYQTEGIDLNFNAWTADGEVVSNDKTATIAVTGDMDLVASYITDFNGDPELDATLEQIDDETLLAHAKANSWQVGHATDGDYTKAFDGNAGTWWHSNYGTATDENKNGNITVTNPIWLQTGTDELTLFGGISYQGRPDPGAGRIKAYEIWVSDSEDMDLYGYTVAASGEFENNASVQFVPFSIPIEGQYVRLVVYSNQGNQGNNYVAACEFEVYKYIGAANVGKVAITIDGKEVIDVQIGDEDNNHYVLKKDIPEISADDFKAAVMDEDSQILAAIEEQIAEYDSIRYNYTLNVSTFDPKTASCELVKTDIIYNVTIQDGENENVELSGKYDELLYLDANAGTFYNAADPDGFAYWQIVTENGNGEIIGTSSEFNYRATQNLTVEAVYGKTADYGVYIPDPIASKIPGTDEYRIEVPVTIINGVRNTGDGDHEIDPAVTNFGIVLVNTTATVTEDDVKAAIDGTSNDNVRVSSAFGAVDLTNKGRYLHTLTVSNTENVAVYGYAVINGKVVLSQLRTL